MNSDDQLQSISTQTSSGIMNSTNQPVDGGYVGLSTGTNDTSGVTLGGDLSAGGTDATAATTPAKTGLTTTEYVAIGIIGLVVGFYIYNHRKAA